MKQILQPILAGFAAIALLTGCAAEDGYVQQPTIELETGQEDDPLIAPDDPDAPENEGLRLPSEEETIAGAGREASDLALTITSLMLSYGPNDSARAIVNDIRPLVTDDLLSELAAQIQERDWDAINSGTTEYIADVTDLEIISYRDGIPEIVEASASVFAIEGGEYPESPDSRETWHITVTLLGFSNSLAAAKAERVG